jgi:phosphate butyryltransferase
MKSFDNLISFAEKIGKKRCIVVMAQDETVLEGIKMAQELNLILPVLIGNKDSILQHAKNVNLDLNNMEIHAAQDENEAIKKSISLVKEHGDFLMKGALSTSAFLKGVLNKEWGLRTGKILSHIAVLEISGYHKLIFMSDGGMNPKLDLKIRIDIINNAVKMMKAINIQQPKIGLIAASEVINPDMPETTDAVKIVNLNKTGEIKDCIIEGPFGFDVAISKKASDHKKIKSAIAGDVDFLLMPNISAANIWAKGLIFFASAKAAGMIAGAAKPVIMLSRADKPETKLNSIALGVALSAESGLNI